jgi:hypothetical protein
LEKSRKWIIRDGFTGISRNGSGAPMARGWKKSLGFLTLLLRSFSLYRRREIYWAGRFAASDARKLRQMEPSGRDSTQDWLLPTDSVPPLLSELEARIDEAVAIARASEEAVRVVGAAAADAAGQARRAAELAERASAAAIAASTVAAAPTPLEDASLRGFTERADRVMARLRAVERRLTPARG